ncbi:P-loop containing nucleoside triphosphate hydrolase protein, partial [Dendrothele bispora CBS 962.96]
KIHSLAGTLSGGQKRKLQLAIGLVGGSEVVLIDECTSGVDPLSRRALWRTLTGVRGERTVVFTTHFLDESDLLADHIAILASPGKVVAQGTPVRLKKEFGEGGVITVPLHLLRSIQQIAPSAYATDIENGEAVYYHLRTKDSKVVGEVLKLLEREQRESLKGEVESYDLVGTTMEEVFLELMRREEEGDVGKGEEDPNPTSKRTAAAAITTTNNLSTPLTLTSGRPTSPLHQSLTIFHKRMLIARRAWLTPLLAVLVAICGSTIPLVFLRRLPPTCTRTFRNSTSIPLYLPSNPLNPLFGGGAVPPLFAPGNESSVVETPPNVLQNALGTALENVNLGSNASNEPFAFLKTRNVQDNETFVREFETRFRNYSIGGVSFDLSFSGSGSTASGSGQALVAWEGSSPGLKAPAMINLASNVLFNWALNTSGTNGAGAGAGTGPTTIKANYESFPPVAAGTLSSLRWVVFFGAAMSVYPAFFALYVSKERRSSVQAMQFSNGLSNTVGLWMGHLMFDFIFSVISSTVIVIIFGAVSNQFHGLGIFWVVLILYGVAGTLFAYFVSLFVSSPLAAFAAVAGYQVVMFVLYLAGYLLTLTYAKTSEAGRIITIIHFTLSVLSPVASVVRASLVSVNLFSLLCIGDTITSSAMGDLVRYGGPILYLILYSLVLLAALTSYDSSGSLRSRLFRSTTPANKAVDPSSSEEDVLQEAEATTKSDDLLRVLGVSKTFGRNRVVDDVSFGVSKDTIFALLGPNGAGKMTTFNMIRGDVNPDRGDVHIAGTSVIRNPKTARFSLGVCPQFTAIDSQLTVREHLMIYGRLKGLEKGKMIEDNVDVLLRATGLNLYADRLASKLSGGNQRKLSLAIALIGNPSVVLIDEFSTGVDAKMKREMWKTLRNVAVGKAVIITTHSMEEAAALATKVGILAKRMLAVGTTTQLYERYATYEVHFTCRTREEVSRAQQLMAQVPGARLADDVATRFEVPVETQTVKNEEEAELYRILSNSEDFSEYTVEKAGLESVFLKVIRKNNVLEEDTDRRRSWWRCF